MYSGDSLRSDEVVTFFEDCLRENGIGSANVTHEREPLSNLDTFYVTVQKGREEILAHKATYDLNLFTRSKLQKIIAGEAETVRSKFDELFITTFEYGNRRVDVCPFDGGWARCEACGTTATAPKVQYLVSGSCELSDPAPVKRNFDRDWENMSTYQQTMFKLYLLGLLREHCDTDCPNYKYNTSKKTETYKNERFK